MDPIYNVSNDSLPINHRDKQLKNKDGNFQDLLKSLVSNTDQQIKAANKKAEEFAIGKNHNLHEIMIASEKADLSFRFLLQIRNKLLEAYQEIMRMNF